MRSRWLGCLLVLAACGETPDQGAESPWPLAPWSGDAGSATPFADSGSPVVASPGNPPGTTNPGTTNPGTTNPGTTNPGTTNPGTTDPGTTNPGTTNPGATGNGLPCEVQKIFKDKCQTCHSDPVVGAPMPLVNWAHLQANSTVVAGQKIAARIKVRINDTKMPMPPAGRPVLTAAEKSALEAYLTAGAQQSTASCTTTPVVTEPDTAYQPPDSECDVLVELRAHGGQGANDKTPFVAPQGGDHYEIFYYAPTWTEKMHTIRIDPIIDNGAVLHHWLLYMKPSGSEVVGSHMQDSGLQSSDSQLLAGWAPGNKSIPLGRDIGMQTVFGTGARLGIEIHYNTNSNPANRSDRSGARLCLTKKLRPKEAGTHWLGTQLIASPGLGGMVEAYGTCSVKYESHIIAHSPHMHIQGRYMKSIITKQGGGTVKLTDKPFSFDDQQVFPVDAAAGEIVVKPGDIINTTCTYDGTKFFTFGPGTSSEMCYNFITAWPSGSLSNGSPGVVGGKNTCIDGL